MPKSNYTIKTEIVKNKPIIYLNLSYKDRFINESHNLIGSVENEKISFSFINNKHSLENNNKTKTVYDWAAKDVTILNFHADKDYKNKSFINELSSKINDYDFVEDFKKNHLENFNKEVSDFVFKCESAMISDNTIYEGYKHQLQRKAGIKKTNENLR